jgi:integrase
MTAFTPNSKKHSFNFTADIVDALPLPGDHKTYKFWDSKDPDLCVITRKTGRRSYYLIKTIDRQKYNILLGETKDILPKAARISASDKRTEIRDGRYIAKKDVQVSEELAWARKATANDILNQYIKSKPRLSENTKAEYTGAIENTINPVLGKKTPLMGVRRSEIITAVAKVINEGSEAEGYRFVKNFRMLWNYINAAYRDANENEIFGASPTDVLKDTNNMPRQRKKSGVIYKSDLGCWWQAAKEFATLTDERWNVRYDDSRLIQSVAARVFLLTGWRLEQLLSLKKEKINYKDQFFIVEDEDTKNRDGRPMPLPSQAISLLKSLDRINKNSEYVFYSPYSDSGYIVGIKGVIDYCSEAIGYRITAHDLRRTHATIGEALGFNQVTIKRLEGHKVAGDGKDVTADYMITYTDTFRRLADAIGDFIDDHHKEYLKEIKTN